MQNYMKIGYFQEKHLIFIIAINFRITKLLFIFAP